MDIEDIKKLKFGSEVIWHSKLDEDTEYIKRVLRVDSDRTSYPKIPPNRFSGIGNNHPRSGKPERYKGSITLWSGHFVNEIDLEEFKKNYRIVKI